MLKKMQIKNNNNVKIETGLITDFDTKDTIKAY